MRQNWILKKKSKNLLYGPSYIGTIGGIGPGRCTGQIDQQFIAPLFQLSVQISKYVSAYVCIYVYMVQVASEQQERAVEYDVFRA